MVNLIDLIGRLLISALFLLSAYNKIFNIDGTIGWMEGFGIPGFLLYPAIALEIILPLLSVFIVLFRLFNIIFLLMILKSLAIKCLILLFFRINFIASFHLSLFELMLIQ